MDTNRGTEMQDILTEIAERENRARNRSILFSLVPVVMAVLLLAWTANYLNNARHELEQLREEKSAIERKLETASDNVVAVATITRQLEKLIESKESYLRSLDEAQFLIDARMSFDSVNKEIRQLSNSFPELEKFNDSRRWVTVIRSSKGIDGLKQSAISLEEQFGKNNIGIYKTPNGYFGLVVRTDGTFTQAYRLTVSLKKTGKAPDAYFAESSGWGEDILK